ncbi:hypothetical protein AMELA_G00092590 [Ameiurus melas]|uniref:Uncharacterized protein n=1 Tax=Ameiurus melas TaxID=219545 RepID=A0A7J6AYA7_AMEME|nr:hypothetical protein AMELA_G00092590 [Ameiurus melas]
MTSLISTTLIMCLAIAELDGSDALLCNRAKFDYGVNNYCLPDYKQLMAASNYQDECPWPNTQRYYYNLDNCFQHMVNITACSEPSLKNKIFLDLHRTYFFHCYFLKDPDVPVLLLFMLPCIIVTFVFPFLCSYITPME